MALIFNGSSVTKELSPFLADLFKFGLLLEDRKMGLVGATPAFLFCPYYIDQDEGWAKPLASFKRYRQFKNSPLREALLYHVGIRPNSYYDSRKELYALKEDIARLNAQKSSLDELRKGIGARLVGLEVALSLDDYQEELEQLIGKTEELKAILDKHKESLADLRNQKYELEVRSGIARRAVDELEKDYVFASAEMDEGAIACPLCGQEHVNSFAERFKLVEDQSELTEVLAYLSIRINDIESQIAREEEKFASAEDKMMEVEAILSVKKNEVELRHILESEGKKQIKEILSQDSKALVEKQIEVSIKINEKEAALDGLVDRSVKQSITELYQRHMADHMDALAVRHVNPKRMGRIDWGVNGTGSEKPRAVLAYYFAVWKLCEAFGSCCRPPIVIDSPRQQNMDEPHYDMDLRFILDNLPKRRQLILGVVETFDFNSDREVHVVELTREHRVLLNSDFEDMLGDVRYCIEATLYGDFFGR